MGSNPFNLDEEQESGNGSQIPVLEPVAEPQPQQIQTANVGRLVDKDTREELIRHYFSSAAVSIFEGCRHLVILRDECDDGEWEGRISRIGFSERTAYRYVQMGRRLLKSEGVAGYMPDKVRAVIDLDEADLREIQEEGTLQGVRLDKYASMSRRKLEDYARRRDGDKRRGEDQLRKLKDEVDDLHAQMAGAPRGQLDQAVLRANIALTQVATFFADEIQGLPEPEAEQVRKEKGWNIYTALMSQMDQLRPVIVDEERLTH